MADPTPRHGPRSFGCCLRLRFDAALVLLFAWPCQLCFSLRRVVLFSSFTSPSLAGARSSSTLFILRLAARADGSCDIRVVNQQG